MEADKLAVSSELFSEYLELYKKSGIKVVSLIGGEPTLHPLFPEFIESILKDSYFEGIIVYTNGSFKSKVIREVLSKATLKLSITLLINYNDPIIVGIIAVKIIEKNIAFAKAHDIRVCLGFNIYSGEQPYEYIIQVSAKFEVPVRWTICTPENKQFQTQAQIKSHFRGFIGIALRFSEACAKHSIEAVANSNFIPICLLSEAELRQFAYWNLATASHCNPRNLLMPDNTATRCYVFTDYKMPLSKNASEKEISDYFRKNIDDMHTRKLLFDECVDCIYFLSRGKSCGCLNYKLSGN